MISVHVDVRDGREGRKVWEDCRCCGDRGRVDGAAVFEGICETSR